MQSSPIHSPAVFRAEAPPHERDMTPRVNMRTIAPRLLHPARKLTRNKQLQRFFSEGSKCSGNREFFTLQHNCLELEKRFVSSEPLCSTASCEAQCLAKASQEPSQKVRLCEQLPAPQQERIPDRLLLDR